MLVWAGGALFATALAVTGWWYGVILGRALPRGGGSAVAVDVTLITPAAPHAIIPRVSASSPLITPPTPMIWKLWSTPLARKKASISAISS